MTITQSILATLAYHDIFDYPLTKQEIHRYLIEKRVSLKTVDKVLVTLLKQKKIIQYSNNNILLALSGRKNLFSLRIHRQKYSKTKFKRAVFFAKILKIVPTFKLVAISGALAMQNSHQNDDIDLVLITSKGTLWTSRFLANILLLPFKRKPASRKVSNRACLNVFIDEADLRIRPQNSYQAHEICQMKPIWDRDGTYQRFLKANSWIKKFLPNWTSDDERLTTNDQRQRKIKALDLSPLALVIESSLKNFQLWYMKGKVTTERIGKYQLFFHPTRTGEWVMGKYQKRFKKLKISV